MRVRRAGGACSRSGSLTAQARACVCVFSTAGPITGAPPEAPKGLKEEKLSSTTSSKDRAGRAWTKRDRGFQGPAIHIRACTDSATGIAGGRGGARGVGSRDGLEGVAHFFYLKHDQMYRPADFT